MISPDGGSLATLAVEVDARPVGRYCLISPCRDEAAFMRRTLDTVAAQTVRPALWVIVDDGSTDATAAILAGYAARFPWIRVVHRKNRGHRSVGPGVVDAFYAGLDVAKAGRFEFLCKLDLDLALPPRYFEILLNRMDDDPRLGTGSGKAYYLESPGDRMVSEGIGDEMSVGAAKFYRRECFEQIGGFVRAVMWDGIDCHRCRMLGWTAGSWDEPGLRFTHLRPMGSSEKGILHGRMRHGRGQYFMGTGPLYMIASALSRLARPPYVLGGLAVAWGYALAVLSRAPRYEDPAFRGFLRRYQRSVLLRGGRKAASRSNASLWRRGWDRLANVLNWRFRRWQHVYVFDPTHSIPVGLPGLRFERYERAEDVPELIRDRVTQHASAPVFEWDLQEIRDRSVYWIATLGGQFVAKALSRSGGSFHRWYLPLQALDITLFRVWTRPEFRGQGLASQLMREIVARDVPRGAHAYTDCRIFNAPSNRMVEKAGFRRIATARSLTRDEALGPRL